MIVADNALVVEGTKLSIDLFSRFGWHYHIVKCLLAPSLATKSTTQIGNRVRLGERWLYFSELSLLEKHLLRELLLEDSESRLGSLEVQQFPNTFNWQTGRLWTAFAGTLHLQPLALVTYPTLSYLFGMHDDHAVASRVRVIRPRTNTSCTYVRIAVNKATNVGHFSRLAI